MSRRGRASPCRTGGRRSDRTSSSPRSPSAWASTRPTSATSTTTTCRRAWRATPRRSAAPAATARPSTCELLACPDDVPTLENFAYGDTPTREALAGAARRRSSATSRAASSRSPSTSSRRAHDIRPLVLKTVLTYLELDGLLRQGTPFYAGYQLRPLDGDARRGRRRVRPSARRLPAPRLSRPARPAASGRASTPTRAAARSARTAARIVAALELPGAARARRAAGGRRAPALHACSRAAGAPTSCSTGWPSASSGASRPRPRASRRCSRSSRTTAARCSALVGYFGEERAEPCGHCTLLPRRASAQQLPAGSRSPPLEAAGRPGGARGAPRRAPRRARRRRASSRASSAASPARRRRRRSSPATPSSARSRRTASRTCCAGVSRSEHVQCVTVVLNEKIINHARWPDFIPRSDSSPLGHAARLPGGPRRPRRDSTGAG